MDVRRRGLTTLLGLGSLFALFAYWIAYPEDYPFSYYPTGPSAAILLGAPGAGAIVGFIEFSTGKPFYEIEESWAALKWWQKLLGGTAIVMIGGAIAFVLVALLVA